MNRKAPCNLFAAAIRRHRAGVFALVALATASGFSVAAQQAGPVDFSSFQIIGQRNIFDPNRRAHSRPRSSGPAQTASDAFSLVGTMSYEKGEFAFFDGTSAEYRKVLKSDGDIADFRVVVIRPDSVTLSTGTNETVLPVGARMRRDDDGRWAAVTEPELSSENSSAAGSGRGSSSRRRASDSTRTDFGTVSTAAAADSRMEGMNADVPEEVAGMETNAPDFPPEAVGDQADDPLTRLMRIRAQEEQQSTQ